MDVSVVIPHWSWGAPVEAALLQATREWRAAGATEIIIPEGGPLPNGGSSIALNINRGLRCASGEYLVVANNDIIPLHGMRVEELMRGDAVTSPIIEGQTRQPFHGCCFAMPRWVYHVLGGLDELFDGYYEDEDFALRCRIARVPLIQSETFTVTHIGGGGGSIGRLDTTAITTRNRERFEQKWGPNAEGLQAWIDRGAPQ